MLAQLIQRLGASTLDVYPVVAVVLLGVSCGAVGALVVANRMAFFSDAMAHTAFLGVGLSLLAMIVLAGARSALDADRHSGIILPVMVATGTAVGLGIGYVREKTGLTNDTVIGVFFAFAVGLGTMLLPAVTGRVGLNTEGFLYGSVATAGEAELATLGLLAAVTVPVVGWRFNPLVFASFNPSLARSRGAAVRANNYLFIVLLALVVNLSIQAIGVLLINALLVVPAAAAANLARNLRQVFWLTVAGSVGSGLVGYRLSQWLDLGPGGTIIVTCVGWFALTMVPGLVRGRPAGAGGDRAG